MAGEKAQLRVKNRIKRLDDLQICEDQVIVVVRRADELPLVKVNDGGAHFGLLQSRRLD
jgi:hypothetical protein